MTLQQATALFVKLLGFQRSAIFLFQPDQGVFRGVLGHQADTKEILRIQEPLHRLPFVEQLFRTHKPLFLENAAASDGLPLEHVRHFELHSLVIAPIVQSQQMMGAILLDRGGQPFEVHDDLLLSCAQFGEYVGELLTLKKFLSPREIEVLQQASLGLSTKEISQRLSLSDYTVRDYLTSAVVKLRSKNRTEAVAQALRLGIIE